MSGFSVISVMAGWIAEMLLCCSLLLLLFNGQKISEYEAYWLMGVPIINPWSAFHEHILSIFCNGWTDSKDAFHAVLCLYCHATDRT